MKKISPNPKPAPSSATKGRYLTEDEKREMRAKAARDSAWAKEELRKERSRQKS